MGEIGRLTSAAALAGCVPASTAPVPHAGDWDASWIQTVTAATDRAIFDWPTLGDPNGGIVMVDMAARYLDNCRAFYGNTRYTALAVMNIRTQAIPAALTDAAWTRFSLGAEYNTKDPRTGALAVENPFWHKSPTVPTTLADVIERGSIALVCDFALGHLSSRLAAKVGRTADDVHRELRASFVPGAIAVPSGIFGLARAQNAGCALIRL